MHHRWPKRCRLGRPVPRRYPIDDGRTKKSRPAGFFIPAPGTICHPATRPRNPGVRYFVTPLLDHGTQVYTILFIAPGCPFSTTVRTRQPRIYQNLANITSIRQYNIRIYPPKVFIIFDILQINNRSTWYQRRQ